MSVLRSIAFYTSLLFFTSGVFFHAHAVLGGEIPYWFFFPSALIFPLFALGIFHIHSDLKELRKENPVANIKEWIPTRPKFLLFLTALVFVYGIFNFLKNSPAHPTKEENGKYYKIENRRDVIEITQEEFQLASVRQDTFFSGHLLIFFCAAMLFHWQEQKRKPAQEKEPSPSIDSNFSAFASDPSVFTYKGEDWSFWYRGVRSLPFWLYMITGFPMLVATLLFNPAMAPFPLFLSLILINVYILHRYHLVSIHANSEYVDVVYYDFLTRHEKKIPRKDFYVSFFPKEIRGNRFYELFILEVGTTLLIQSSANPPFTYKKLEEIYKRLEKK